MAWVMSEDSTLGKYVREKTEIIFRKGSSIGNRLTASEYKWKCNKILSRGLGICGQCSFCPWVQTGMVFQLPNGESFRPYFHATCNTEGVVYLRTCRCGAFYVGKTIRQFKQRTVYTILFPIRNMLNWLHQWAVIWGYIISLTHQWSNVLSLKLYPKIHEVGIGINLFSRRRLSG